MLRRVYIFTYYFYVLNFNFSLSYVKQLKLFFRNDYKYNIMLFSVLLRNNFFFVVILILITLPTSGSVCFHWFLWKTKQFSLRSLENFIISFPFNMSPSRKNLFLHLSSIYFIFQLKNAIRIWCDNATLVWLIQTARLG
jgi:hypothetical protein